MKTRSRHLADNFTSQYRTRVEPQDDGNLVVRVCYPINGTETTRLVSDRQARNEMLIETLLEDIRNELSRSR